MSSSSKATELEAAKEELATALRGGKDTSKARAKIKQLEADIKAEQQKAAEAEQAARAAEAEKIAKASATTLTAEKATIAEAATVEGLAESLPEGDTPAELPDDPALAAAVHALTKAQMAFDAANERHQQAQKSVADLRARIDEKRAREAELKQERLSGSDEGAAELHAIALDLEGLAELLTEAQNMVAQLAPEAERKRVAEAETYFSRVKAKQLAATLYQRCEQAEAVLIAAHRALVEASIAADPMANRFTLFKPSPDLKFITHGTTR